VLSQHTRNDKHKMERFFHIARPTVATVFAPIHFGAMPTIVFHKVCRAVRRRRADDHG
jgi:hypothetical protein